MNTVTVATAVEPHLVTMVNNNTNMRGSVGNRVQAIISSGYSAGVPNLVTNSIVGDGQTNPAGPQLEEKDKMNVGMIGEDHCMSLLNCSPDEHVPLLRREQPPAESTPILHQHHHHQSQPGNNPSKRVSNSNNNNNNRIALGSDIKMHGLEVDHERMTGSEVSQGGGISSAKPEPHLASQQLNGSSVSENKMLLYDPARSATSGHVQIIQPPPIGQDRGQGSYTGPCFQSVCFAEPVLALLSTTSPKAHLVQSNATALVLGCRDVHSGLAPSSAAPASQAQELATKTLTSSSTATNAQTLKALKVTGPEASVLEASLESQKVSSLVAYKNPVLQSQDPEIAPLAEASAPEPAAPQSPASVPQTLSWLWPQMGLAKTKRPERPCSLDLSSSCISSGEPRLNI